MSTSTSGHFSTWASFSAFQVLAEHAPRDGCWTVVRLSLDPHALSRALGRRSGLAEPLDPDLAQRVMRAGLALMTTGMVSFVHATIDGAAAVLRPEGIESADGTLVILNRLLSTYVGRLGVLVGQELPASATVYEFPNLVVARRAFAAGIEREEEHVPHRSAWWLGAQLLARGEAFHPAMIETLEEQTSFLGAHDIDIDRLPPWWWRGLVARDQGGEVEIIEELPDGDEFAALIVGE